MGMAGGICELVLTVCYILFRFENVVGEVHQQKEDIGKLDIKVDTTVDTVVTIGGKVIEHEQEIGQLGEGMERVEERLEEVDEGLGETRVKVEEIDKEV